MYSICVAWVVEAIGWIFQEDLQDKEATLLYNPEVRKREKKPNHQRWHPKMEAQSEYVHIAYTFLHVPCRSV